MVFHIKLYPFLVKTYASRQAVDGKTGDVESKRFVQQYHQISLYSYRLFTAWLFENTGQMVFKGIINRIGAGKC